MRIARIQDKRNQAQYGIVEGDQIAVAEGDPIAGLRRMLRGLSLSPDVSGNLGLAILGVLLLLTVLLVKPLDRLAAKPK
jgi:hypothetical protein